MIIKVALIIKAICLILGIMMFLTEIYVVAYRIHQNKKNGFIIEPGVIIHFIAAIIIMAVLIFMYTIPTNLKIYLQ